MYLLEWRQIPDKCWIGCFCELSFVGDFVAGMLNFKGFKIEIPQEMLPWDTPFQKWYGYSCHFPTSLSSKWWDLKHVTYGQRPPKTPSLISMSYCWWKKNCNINRMSLSLRVFFRLAKFDLFLSSGFMASTYFNSKNDFNWQKTTLAKWPSFFFDFFFGGGFPVIKSSFFAWS